MSKRPPDYHFDALVEATRAMVDIERGSLNTALKAIRAQCERDGIHPDSIPEEIHRRAVFYEEHLFPGLTVTPMALAKHWNRCLPKQPEQRETLPQMYERMKREKQNDK